MGCPDDAAAADVVLALDGPLGHAVAGVAAHGYRQVLTRVFIGL